MRLNHLTNKYIKTFICSLAALSLILTPLNIRIFDIELASVSDAWAKKSGKRAKELSQTETGRWAAAVVDAATGRIIYEKNAEKQRYPASLTKMMTLYLLFDAVQKKRLTMNSQLTASRKAAAQPQTNLSLGEGDQLSVKTAIQALVVRSANDVAMVVAESLGGSQAGFAKKMNQKALELGMRNTRFYNPSGLPDDRQKTTALDMAKLGIALRRDFPEYFHFFNTRAFTYHGKEYTTHNRVLGRYPGADGMKTGYIRASGFNLVTSVTRGRTRLVAVVMGGRTGASRDQEMMSMLDRVFFKLGEGKTAVAAAKPAPLTPGREERKPLPSAPAPQTLPAPSGAVAPDHNWAVQVGAFPTEQQAHIAAANARNIAPHLLKNAELVISTVVKDGKLFNRSRLLFLTANEAREACGLLTKKRKQCMVIRMEY